ncbi:MAG: hypothetical protein KDA24_26355, partial [Deltaproteobacteria bacterium]|nr:hypothetical protein [Deltaproteobacteria bacterium]
DATGDDDDATGDDDDATGDDDDSGGGDDDDSAGGDDDDATGDDDDATGDDDDSSGDDDDSSGPCGMGDMTTALEVRVGGSPGASFSPTDNLTFAAIVHNPCPFEVTITSISTCLVSSWTATDSNGLATGAGVACGDAFTDFTVPSFDSIEETTSMGTFTAETYVGTADIDVPGLPDPTTGFTVQ